MKEKMETVLIGLRSNLLEGLKPLREAVQTAQSAGSEVQISNVYKSEGLGLQQGWLAELWAVLRMQTDRDVSALVSQIEGWGQSKSQEFTLLSFGSHVVLNPHMPIPNPNLHRLRIFLQCAAEVEPTFIHPILGQSLLQLVNSDARALQGEFFAQGRQLLKAD